MEVSSTFWLPDITDWWWQQEEMHSMYADLCNVAHDMCCIITRGVGLETRFSLGRDVIRWRQSKTTGETLHTKVVVRLFALSNNGLLAGDDPDLDRTSTENDMEMKKAAEQNKLHRIVKVNNLLEIRQGRHDLRATQKESHTQNKQITAVGYIRDMEEIITASWSLWQHAGAAAFKLCQKSPLRPALSVKDLCRGRTEIFNVCQINRIDHHSPKSDEDSSSESISDPENWLNWDGDFDNPNVSEDNWEADNESDMRLDNGSKNSETPEQRNVSVLTSVPGLIRPI
jgi:hypothetical protein